MKVTVIFEGVVDHLDVLDEETSKCRVLMEYLQRIYCQIPEDNYELSVQLKSIIGSLDSLQKNIHNRKNLLLHIVDELKKAKGIGDERVAEIGYTIDNLSNEV